MHEEDEESKPSNVKPTIIVQRKIKKYVHKHHGGSWKIAYADFVTAMMTFFLLLWLLSMLNKSQLDGISAYFKKPYQSGVTSDVDEKKDKIYSETTVKSNDQEKRTGPSNVTESNPTDAKSFQQSEQMKAALEKQINQDPTLNQYKTALNLQVTSQGLKIDLKDLDNQPMFSNGKTDFADYAVKILGWLANALNKYPNRVMIVGHTDSKPIVLPNYSNWELSSDRASATRRTLINSGMDYNKVVRIVGAGDTDNLPNTTADNPANRRISIIVLTDDAYTKMQNE